mgnify:FL=1
MGGLGGKPLVAGGGRFSFVYVNPENQKRVKEALSDLHQLPFKFENSETRMAYYY